MSAISTILTRLRAAIWAIDVRDDIANAIEQCYSDVSNPTLKTEALEAALQNKIDEGKMAALTIGDHTITAAKLAQGVIDNTLATSGAAADAKKTGDEISAIKADLGDLDELETTAKTDLVSAINEVASSGLTADIKQALLACFAYVAWKGQGGQSYYDALELALYPDATHTIHGWLYEFDDSLLSSGDRDFGFIGTALYSEGVRGKAYHHKVATEGTSSTDPQGIYKTGLTDIPDLTGDFTLSVWHKSTTNKRGHVFTATKYNSGGTVPAIKGTIDNALWRDDSTSGASVSDTYKGIRLIYGSSSGNLSISLSSAVQSEILFVELVLPSSIDTTQWHHHAITRSNGVIRYFFDGGLVWHIENSDPIVFADQICLGNGFGSTQATINERSQTGYSDQFDDLYIAEFAKWTANFDPTSIVY